jgi:hypothetical protein
MKHFVKYFFSLVIGALLFSSCSKKNNVGKMIPSDAMFVAQVNLKSIESKLPLSDIKQSEWFKKAIADPSAPEWRNKILENPSASGIDLNEGLTFFVVKNSGQTYFVAEGKIKNEKDFEQFNKNFDSAQTIKNDGEINLLVLKDKGIVGWNGNYFAYVTSTPENPYKNFDSDRTENSQPKISVDNAAELSGFCKKLFTLKTDSSLAGNDKFAALVKENGDIHAWQNNEALIKSAPSLGMLSMMKLDALTKDNISTYTVNFENGKISIDQNQYTSKELSDILKKYMGSSVNMAMIKNIPSQDVVGLMAFNFKPEGIKEIIKLTGTDGLANSFLQELGFNLDDVSKATNGDFLLAFSDLQIQKTSSAGNDSSAENMMPAFNKPDFNYIFSLGIGDKASFQKIIDALKKQGSQMGADSLVNKYVMNDKTFAFGSSTEFANKYLAGNSNSKYDFSDKISGHPFGFFLDLHKIISAFATTQTDKANEKAMLDLSLNTWENILADGGDFKNGGFQFHTEINLVNKDTNSLKQLNNYFNEMHKLSEAEKNDNTTRLDSLLVPPPTDTVKVK